MSDLTLIIIGGLIIWTLLEPKETWREIFKENESGEDEDVDK